MKKYKAFFSLILLLLFSFQSRAETFETKSVVEAEYSQNSASAGEIRLLIKDGWHVNANPASMDFLIPVKVTFPGDSKLLQVSYPAGHAIETPLGELSVYSGIVSIPILLKPEQKSNSISLTAQACDGATCYPPSTWNFPLKIEKAE